MERNSFKSKSAVLADLFKIVEIAANTESPVLITGEAASEKEFFARMLHFDGVRREKPFVLLNCATTAATVQDEFLACVKSAGEGTLFLDEVALLSPQTQQNLLRLVQNKNECGARIVAASRYNLEQTVLQGGFNKELLSILSGVVLRVPALGERLSGTPDFEKAGLPAFSALFASGGHKSLKDAENIFKKNYIESVLQTTKYNQTKAAEILAIQRTYLSRLLTELGIRR